MNILITGGTGFIGRHLTRALTGQGFHCTCLVRPTSNTCELRKLNNTEIIYGDIIDKGSLKTGMRDIQVIYHLAGQVGQWDVPEERFFAANVEGTRNLLDVAKETEVKHFIFCSTPGVQGKGYMNASEDLPYNPPYSYELTKAEAEKSILAFSENQMTPRMTIVRPDFVYGPGDFRRLPLYRAIKNRRFFLIGDATAFIRPTFVEDAVKGLCIMPNNPASFSQIFNIAGPHILSVEDFIQTIAEILKVSLPKIRIPILVARILAMMFESASHFTGRDPLLSLSKIDFLTKHHGTDISKAMDQLGFRPKVDLKTGLRRTIDWYFREHLL